MDDKYSFENIRLKGNKVYIEEYITYNTRLSNMFKYGKIDEQLYIKCQWYAFTKLQNSYPKKSRRGKYYY